MSSNTRTLSLKYIDQLAIWCALVLLAFVSWMYLFDQAQMMEMAAMGMSGEMDMKAMSTSKPWQLIDYWNMFLMWSVMMIAMMVPSAARTLMIFSRIDENHSTRVISRTYLFLMGYLVIWAGFSVAATGLQAWFNQAELLSTMMAVTDYRLGGSLLILAGLYQLTPMKQTCLAHCQSPIDFISKNFRAGYLGAFTMGLQHGGFCLGCCWGVMLLLFVAGVMDLFWILVITLFVLFEKLLPVLGGTVVRYFSWLSSTGLMALGIIFWILEIVN